MRGEQLTRTVTQRTTADKQLRNVTRFGQRIESVGGGIFEQAEIFHALLAVWLLNRKVRHHAERISHLCGCGKGGIRTLGTGFARTNAFQAFQLNHSCTFPDR